MKDSIVDSSVQYTKKTISFLYKWLTTDGEALGYILGHIHFMLFIFLMTGVIISHTVYPSFWLQLILFLIICLIWLQHICLKVCISVVAEKELTKNVSPFHQLFESIFQITTHDFINYFIVAETTALCCLGLELISRCSIYLQNW